MRHSALMSMSIARLMTTIAPYIDSNSCISHETYAGLLANGRWYVWWHDGQFIRDTFDTAATALTVREFYGFTQPNGQFGYIVRTFHDLYPDRVSRKMGDSSAAAEWFAENFAGRYPLGETFIPLMTLYYDSHASCTLNLSVATLLPTLSITPPEKTVYHYREALEYTGYSAAASYSNGDTEDVTALVTFYPRAGSIVTSSAVFSPANGTVITDDMTGSVSVSYTNEWLENATGNLSLSIE